MPQPKFQIKISSQLVSHALTYLICVFVDFHGVLRARVYDDEVRKWISGVGVEHIGKRLVKKVTISI